MVQCTECHKWRLIFSKQKLNKRQVKQLQDAFKDIDYICGMMLGEWCSVICWNVDTDFVSENLFCVVSSTYHTRQATVAIDII